MEAQEAATQSTQQTGAKIGDLAVASDLITFNRDNWEAVQSYTREREAGT
jgi:hypothetical protein